MSTADDLFAGAGGWDVAANALGIHARGIENMPQARATREAAGLTTIHDDVWTYQPDGTASGLIASPPCQTFSTAGKGAGAKALDDVLRGIRDNYYADIDHLRFLGEEVREDRTALVLTPLHFATQYNYEWLAWEQVPAVLPVWEACADVLRGKGWNVWTGFLYSEQYGVPQARKRAFLLASRRHLVVPPIPTHSRYYSRDPHKLDVGVLPWVSMAEGLGYRPGDGQARNSGPGAARASRSIHEPSYTIRAQGSGSHPSGVEWVLRGNQRPEGGVNRVDEDGYLIRSIDEPAITVTGNARSFHWREMPDWTFNRPSTTIVGTFRPDVVAAPGYRTEVSRQNAPNSVRVTVAEAGVLQTFPWDFPWQGAEGKKYLQAGNAVPVLMAMHALGAAAGVDAREAAA